MNIYNRNVQVTATTAKIAVALERLAVVQKYHLQQIAKAKQLTPLQMQLLIFIHQHQQELNNTSYLAQEFAVTKPTISDALNALAKKQLLQKKTNTKDKRGSYFILSSTGQEHAQVCEHELSKALTPLEQLSSTQQHSLWGQLSDLLVNFASQKLIPMRMCQTCHHFQPSDNKHPSFCQLLNQPLGLENQRIDCAEHQMRS